jgi:hypothetical protein
MDTKPMMCHDLAAIFEMVEFQNVKINSPSFIEICRWCRKDLTIFSNDIFQLLG